VHAERAWFRQFAAAGVDVGSHSTRHVALSSRSREVQRHEVCGSKRVLKRLLMVRPRLFRPPYGSYDRLTRRVTAECYLPILVSWNVVVQGGTVYFRSGDGLRPGDIVLLHFGRHLLDDMRRVLRLGRQHGLRPARLSDYLENRVAPTGS
jgi:peptidoglycan/xylan/chitin deacetylase (PgdA/CDA1 family)